MPYNMFGRKRVLCLFSWIMSGTGKSILPSVSAGGFRGDYNCALEPANGYYDDIRIAHRNQSLYYLRKGKPLQFTLELEVCKY